MPNKVHSKKAAAKEASCCATCGCCCGGYERIDSSLHIIFGGLIVALSFFLLQSLM